MGYGIYFIWSGGEERPAGYEVIAECDRYGCHAVIDRGMGYVCGGEPHDLWNDEPGCGRYYCEDHLSFVGERGGCAHPKTPSPRNLGRLLSDMVPNKKGDVCLDPVGHDGPHAWATFEHGETQP